MTLKGTRVYVFEVIDQPPIWVAARSAEEAKALAETVIATEQAIDPYTYMIQ